MAVAAAADGRGLATTLADLQRRQTEAPALVQTIRHALAAR